MLKVSAIHIYPVKSCRGISLPGARITDTGFAYDRTYMVVDEMGKFLTQREAPRLCLIQPYLTRSHLVLREPNMRELASTTLRGNFGNDTVEITFWKQRRSTIDQGEDAAKALSEFLGITCRLVRLPPYKSLQRLDHKGNPVAFMDAHPFLIISDASLADLNTRLSVPLPMNRFRPNIVITGCGPYEEDSWNLVEIKGTSLVMGVRLEGAEPCTRCEITTVDQKTGIRGKEPLRTLAKYRRGDRGIAFGKYFGHLTKGVVSVGQSVEVILREK